EVTIANVLYRFAIDDQYLVAVFDNIARQPHNPLDIVYIRIHGVAKHHDIAATGRAKFDHFLVDHRQTNAVLEFIHQNQIPILQGRQHRPGRDTEWFDHKRSQNKHEYD